MAAQIPSESSDGHAESSSAWWEALISPDQRREDHCDDAESDSSGGTPKFAAKRPKVSRDALRRRDGGT